MNKGRRIAILAGFLLCAAGVITLGLPVRQTLADSPCVTTNFTTEMYKAACARGGQKAARDAAKAWNKEKKIRSCNQCHSKLAPRYERKPDALAQFKRLGGK